MEQLLALVEHGGIALILAYMLYQERKERIAQSELLFAQLQKCLDDQSELIDEEFGPTNK